MKIIAALLLLILSVFFAGGYYFAFVVAIHNHKSEMQIAIDNSSDLLNTTTIVFTAEEYDLLKVNEKELMIDGKMYDIVSEEFSDSVVTVTCVDDGKETGLLQSFSAYNNNFSSKKSHDLPFQLIRFCSHAFFENPNTFQQTFFSSSFLLGTEVLIPESITGECPAPPPPDINC